MLVFSTFVAGSFVLGSMAANHIAPTALNAVRFAAASILLGVIAGSTSGLKAWHARAPWRYVVLGGMFSLYFVMMFEGLKTADPVSASAVFTLTPAMSALFAWPLLRQGTSRGTAAALVVGGAGALWVIFKGDLGALVRLEVGRGEFIYFWGCVAHALYIPMVRILNRGEPALSFTFFTLLGSCAVLLVWGWGDIAATDWMALPPIVWITIGYTAIFATGATSFLLQYASLRLRAANVMAYTYLTPSWVILWGIALGAPLPGLWALGGIALTILALVLLFRLSSSAERQRQEPTAPAKGSSPAR